MTAGALASLPFDATDARAQSVAARVGSEPYDVFGIWGQSNCFGAVGGYDPRIDVGHPRLFQYTYDRTITPAVDPLNFRGGGAPRTIGFSVAFARDYYIRFALAEGRRVLLVPCAEGGVAFTTAGPNWSVGSGLYEDAIRRVNAAMAINPGNSLKAIMFQGGEGDMYVTDQVQYTKYFQTMAADARSRLSGGGNVPFLCGNIAKSITDFYRYPIGVDLANKAMDKNVPNCAAVDSWNPFPLTTNNAVPPDGHDAYGDKKTIGPWIHYDCQSQRELGKRYYVQYAALTGSPPMK